MVTTKVSDRVLDELGKLSPEFARAAHNVREASETPTLRAAEKALGTIFLLTPGAAFKAGLTRGEENAVATLVHGRGYEEPEE